MASRASKRKKPSKDDYLLKERFKIESEVFDRETLMSISKMFQKGILETVDYPISTGKEANVFRATTPSGAFAAVKIYKIETALFLKKSAYLDGDPRFERIKHSDREIVFAFARKEFKNLQICEKAGVHAPKPYYVDRNIMVMEFLGEEGLPYPQMSLLGPRGEEDLDAILADLKKMHKAGLVHADVSEFNILLGKTPYLIDFGQGVVLSHPKANDFLERDVRNIIRYFEKCGFKKDAEKELKKIRG